MQWLRVFGISVVVFIITALAMSAMASVDGKTWRVCLKGGMCRVYPDKKLALDYAATNLQEIESVVEIKELNVKARVSFATKK